MADENISPIRLELTKDEAEFLAVVLANIGGDEKKSARRHTGPIGDKLMRNGGVHFADAMVSRPDLRAKEGVITFLPVPAEGDGKIRECALGLRGCDCLNDGSFDEVLNALRKIPRTSV